ncbi:hypothetical protein VTN77DRAFT_2116 [Rasamsonia byssochlamydoides]|uniref:uncharacterized protein n=1 Tax=Rasamsonia byssochlamydoides TaxID=89139 RepID=UPI00374417B9
MGRRKIEIKAIKDDRNRSVTFLKRKGGLFKKAHELSVLCSVDVAVIIFGHNKKLYEFSSGDIRETLGRYQYWGPPHEHKGPADFAGKTTADDDDDDDASGAEDTAPSQPQAQQGTVQQPQPHLQNQHQPTFQHVNQAPSASPPIPNGVGFDPRHGTPQPQVMSRPSSRNHVRRVSSNLVTHPHPPPHATPPPPPAQNGFAYMPNPSIYNPNANPNLNPQAPRPAQYPPFAHPPHLGPQHQTPQPHPAQPIPQHHQPPPLHHLPQQAPHHSLPQPPHQQMPQIAQPYMQDQGRHSMPPAFPPEQQQHQQQQQQPPPPPPPPQQRPIALPDPTASQQIPNQMKPEGSQSPRPPAPKSRSIFTPIDDQGSVLARHFGVGPSLRESPQREAPAKQDLPPASTTSQSVPITSAATTTAPPQPTRSATDPQRAQSTSMPEIPPPPRANSAQVNVKRPRLKVQIPSEQSDAGSATADSSPRDSAGHKTATPAKVTSDANHTGVVLPPPSPSAGALLSAGAQGPPNPFARPPPPGTNSQNGTGYGSSNNMDTPISALPSRFVSDALLPSPSSFFPEWGFGRSGPDTNMLPSPLTFPTPSVQTGPGFGRDDELDRKRKSPEGGVSADSTPGKKLKT